MLPILMTLLPVAAPPVYTPAEAVEDVLSDPLEYVGRGPWFGMARWEACVYRNGRVLLVDVYCARDWPQAFSVRVFSPGRGRVELYVETEKPAAELTRAEYDDATWKIESERPPGGGHPAVELSMSFEQLRDYEERRYRLYLPACYIDRGQPRCHAGLEHAGSRWQSTAGPFWRKPGAAWYRLVQQVRRLAAEHGT
jgi:hypothetical protein